MINKNESTVFNAQGSINISKELFVQYVELDEKHHLAEKINQKQYSASDSPLTYRKINYIENIGLMDSQRSSESKWRKFSYKDLVYHNALLKIMHFGVKCEHLKNLKALFYQEEKIIEKTQFLNPADIAIGLTLAGHEIILCLSSNWQAMFIDSRKFIKKQHVGGKYYLFIPMQELIDEIKECPFEKSSAVINSMSALTSTESELSLFEKNLISLVRNENYRKYEFSKDLDFNSNVTVKTTKYISGKKDYDDIKKQLSQLSFASVEMKIEDSSLDFYIITEKHKLEY